MMLIGFITRWKQSIIHMKGLRYHCLGNFIIDHVLSLHGSPFTLVIDHQPPKFLMDLDCFTKKLTRWAFILQEYDFDIIHRLGRVNWVVDGSN
jgi:hypothetical protein